MAMARSLLDSKRYREIRDAAGRALVEHSDGLLPVTPREIFRHLGNNCCIPFTEYRKRMSLPGNMTSSEFFGSQDAHTSYCPDTGYIVVYNNDDRAMKSLGRLRWTLAHELGHVVLGHLSKGGADAEYELHEQEADYFASMLLAYPAVIRACNVRTATVLQALCGLSMPAATSRFAALQRSTMMLSLMDERVLQHFEQVIWEQNLPFVTEQDFTRYGR